MDRETVRAVIEAELRDHVRVVGPQAVEFLQGQLSQDVAGLAVGEWAPSFLLEPNGKVTAWLIVRRRGDDDVVLDLDAGVGPAVVERLNRFKLRTKATIELQPAESADGPAGPVDDAQRREARRIDAGIPRTGADLVPGQTIPAEAGPAIIDASVSFTKGCYTGQELVARVDSRGGHAPRQLRRVVVDAPAGAVPPVGAAVVLDGREVGHLTSVAWSADRGAAVALASVARAVEPPAAAVVRGADGEHPARVEGLPPDGEIPSAG